RSPGLGLVNGGGALLRGRVEDRVRRLEPKPRLLDQDPRQLRPGDRCLRDEDLAELAAGPFLLGERGFELALDDEPVLDEELAEQARPGRLRYRHFRGRRRRLPAAGVTALDRAPKTRAEAALLLEVKLALLRQQAHEEWRRHEAAREQDLAQRLLRLRPPLRGERVVQLLRRQHALAEEELAEPRASRVGSRPPSPLPRRPARAE